MDLEALARECCDVTEDRNGRLTFEFDDAGLARFARLVAEECAKVAMDYPKTEDDLHPYRGEDSSKVCAFEISSAISELFQDEIGG